jgi:pimeloyl-ACP methyl ester carboxylesterase
MNAVSPGMGDIVYSQRRGEDILDALRKDIEAIPGQVAVLGHSLGGEHLVNLLTRNRPKNVVRLVTVASQIAYFTACDSMRDLRLPLKPGSRDPVDPPLALPADFPAWFNFFDRNDFLSFRAAPCFTGGGGVTDEEITSGVPFPDSHGAYFRTPDFYRRLVACLK